MGYFVFVLGLVLIYYTYKQLFGYGTWGTIWRLIATFTAAILLASLFLWLDYCFHMLQAGLSIPRDIALLEPITIIVFIVILWVSYRIGESRATKREQG